MTAQRFAAIGFAMATLLGGYQQIPHMVRLPLAFIRKENEGA
jgi:hypothetical protein